MAADLGSLPRTGRARRRRGGDQNELDHRALERAVDGERIAAETGV